MADLRDATDARLDEIKANLARELDEQSQTGEPYVSAMDIEWLVQRVEGLRSSLEALARLVETTAEACEGCGAWSGAAHSTGCTVLKAYAALGWTTTTSAGRRVP